MRAKRFFDVAAALVGLCILLPLLALLAISVWCFLGRPVLFRQIRPGYAGAPFTLIKFRSMTDQRDCDGRLLPDERRLTSFGRFMRKSSLDELPELYNVLKGEMSLVGPRPLVMQYLPYFTERERLRFTILPGITGWAQIHGRNEATWDQRLDNDVWYVENRNFRLDLFILFKTVSLVIQSKGVVVAPSTVLPDLDVQRKN
jgi:lipopolysaccharide/colanic/teichoic acid biosynthesis glycosyltransferase